MTEGYFSSDIDCSAAFVHYAVPDVSQWATWLSPGPADVRVAHEAGE